MNTKPELAKKLGILIRECRKSAKLNQAAFGMATLNKERETEAKACQAWVSRVELGATAGIDEAVLVKMAEIVGVAPELFLAVWAEYKVAKEVPKNLGGDSTSTDVEMIEKVLPGFKQMFAALANLSALDYDSEILVLVMQKFIDDHKGKE